MAATPENAPRRYRIGDLIIDTGMHTVMRGDEDLRVVGLTYDLLLALAETAPSLASYDFLVDRVWNGRDPSPETITQRAKMLRAAISDDAAAPRYFELVRGQGYRMVADVRALAAPTAKRRKPWIVVAAAMLVVAGVYFSKLVGDGDQLQPSVAVLPFEDLSEFGDQRFLADGVAEELINELASLDGLDVASRTESFFYRGPARDLAEIGEALNVAAVLEGSVRKSGDSLRVTVQLIEVESGFHLWAENFDSETEDIFDIQETIATSVAGALGVKLGVGGVNEFVGAGTKNYEAYEAFLRRDFERAIELDPNYAAAWSRQAVRIASTIWSSQPAEAPEKFARALPYALKAIELDPNSAQAHSDLAALQHGQLDWTEAEQSFSRAHELHRTVENTSSYGNMMLRAGRVEMAVELYQSADELRRTPWPARRAANVMRSNAQLALGNAEAARQMSAHMHEQVALFDALTIAINFGTEEEVRAAIEALPKSTPDYNFLYGPVLELLHSPSDAIAFIAELAKDPGREWPYKFEAIALLAAYLGDPDTALQVFSEDLRYTAVRYNSLWLPVMSEMRQLPEFKQLMIDVNLVDYWRQYGWSDSCRPVSDTDFACK